MFVCSGSKEEAKGSKEEAKEGVGIMKGYLRATTGVKGLFQEEV